VVWILLVVAFFMWTEWIPGKQIAGFLAVLALITYLVFLLSFALTGERPDRRRYSPSAM
jgi:hypothetical protein